MKEIKNIESTDKQEIIDYITGLLEISEEELNKVLDRYHQEDRYLWIRVYRSNGQDYDKDGNQLYECNKGVIEKIVRNRTFAKKVKELDNDHRGKKYFAENFC